MKNETRNDFFLILSIGVATLLCALSARSGLTPDTFSLSWYRTNVTANVDTNVYLMGTSYLLQSNQVFAASGAAQDLTGLGGYVTAGATESNLAFAITADVATNGIFDCQITTPVWAAYSGELLSMQLTLTNGAGTVVTYRGLKQLNITRGLH
jgi:hypothetical protein